MSKATELFEIQKRLAVGDAGLVYRAVDKSGRVVALKLLLTEDQVAHPLDVAALLADAPRLQTVTGVNIVQLLDAFPDEDGTVLVYECAEGHRGLDVPAARPIAATDAVDVAAQILSALRSGERQRHPHGDLKPSDTVVIDLPDGRPLVMVLDWGLANYRRDLSSESFAYTAPERLSGSPPSHIADLFSAGATLHYLFTGKRLLPCSSREEFMAAWPSLDLNALGGLRPDLPKGLVSLVASLISPDASGRPESAVKALEQLAAMSPPLPPAVPEKIRPRTVRAPVVSSGVVAPVSAVRPAPIASSVQAVPQTSAAASADPSAVIAAAKAEVARLQKKRQTLTLVSMGLGLVACLGFLGLVAWKKRSEEAERAAIAKAGEAPLPPKIKTPAPEAISPSTPAPVAPNAVEAVAPVRAEFPVQDSFEYAAGANLAGQSGGIGWAGPWAGEGSTIEAESLVNPGLPSFGAKLLFPRGEKDAIVTRVVSPKVKLLEPKGGTFYFAISVQHSDDPFGIESEFQFNPLDGTAPTGKPVRVILRDQGKGFEATLHTVNNRQAKEFAKAPNGGKVVNVVQRFVVKPLPDGKSSIVSDIWLNPNPKSSKIPAPDSTFSLPSVVLPLDLTLMLRKKPTPTTRVDEVRYSKTWVGVFR
jgi:hypothetical protein